MDITNIEHDAMYTATEAAKLLHVTKPTIYSWTRRGILQATQYGNTYRYSGAALLNPQHPNAENADWRDEMKQLLG